MVLRRGSVVPLALFTLGVATVYPVALTVVSRLDALDPAGLLAAAATMDLTLFVPLLWILTGLSAYAMVWLLGDTRAMVARATRIEAGMLHLRVGLRWTADIPLERVDRVSEAPGGPLQRGAAGYLNTAPLGPPNRRLHLREPVMVLGPYGLERRVTTLDLRIDGNGTRFL